MLLPSPPPPPPIPHTQAYGARRFSEMGNVLQRAALVVAAAVVPVAVLWANSAKFFIALGQDPAIAALAQTYLR